MARGVGAQHEEVPSAGGGVWEGFLEGASEPD